MFSAREDVEPREVLPGVRLRTLVHGDLTMLCEFEIAQGAVIPVHDHPNEQTGYLVSGRLEFTIEGKTSIAEPGTAWNLDAGQPHGARGLEDCVVVEVFSPVRADYLP
ncbi:MAG: cupin domain-containing protein [bacterium]|nr:cupin domain-containing protein [bacterium]